MCGNATLKQDIDKLIDRYKINLILTDPPYGMKCQKKDGTIGERHHTNSLKRNRGGVKL